MGLTLTEVNQNDIFDKRNSEYITEWIINNLNLQHNFIPFSWSRIYKNKKHQNGIVLSVKEPLVNPDLTQLQHREYPKYLFGIKTAAKIIINKWIKKKNYININNNNNNQRNEIHNEQNEPSIAPSSNIPSILPINNNNNNNQHRPPILSANNNINNNQQRPSILPSNINNNNNKERPSSAPSSPKMYNNNDRNRQYQLRNSGNYNKTQNQYNNPNPDYFQHSRPDQQNMHNQYKKWRKKEPSKNNNNMNNDGNQMDISPNKNDWYCCSFR